MGAPNSANPAGGTLQSPSPPALPDYPLKIDCDEKKKDKGWDDCQIKQMCKMVKGFNESPHPKKRLSPSPSEPGSKGYNDYCAGLAAFTKKFGEAVDKEGADGPTVKGMFSDDCQHEKWKNGGAPREPPRSGKGRMSPDHVHDAGLGGPIKGAALIDNLSWTDGRVNTTVGACMKGYDPEQHGKVTTNANCGCDA